MTVRLYFTLNRVRLLSLPTYQHDHFDDDDDNQYDNDGSYDDSTQPEPTQ